MGCWTRPAGRAHILLRSLRWAPGLRWQRDKKKVSSNRHNDNGPTASTARVAPKCSRRPRVHIVMAVAQVTCCSIPSVESLAMQYSWTSRNSIGVRMNSTDLAVDGGELQVLSGSGTLAESGRQVGSGSRWGFAETLEGTLVIDLNDDGQGVHTRGQAYELEEYSMYVAVSSRSSAHVRMGLL